ncbi:MAG: CinA family nicotinamide mononucleotide deamidase-related protein [Deltaproteobacteria bacterium]|nr:CinA family nicotinamide mononucleotide deamidase-related protein [Deltaproteobacteria bacterium]MBK8240228.1 CinA family nicotinamide mononucleotide deamidase-related protein [Deltaproteobacteria bacterium]MBK8714616.1 CinA family nicotinamide mononucleotide deamidase-related protein [Deltaproteobacteria bacterium]MBP7292218.1 CinA family nicotinamide mononucleotide deamidase-related protein [Nannocystaceae bacterium]
MNAPAPRVEVLSIGDELLSGDTVNTNATFLGARARELGLLLTRVEVVRDRHEEIVTAVRGAVARADVLWTSGGLGPTTDDLTTAAIADAAGCPVVRDEAAVARLREKFRRFAREMPVANLKQADRPERAQWLDNPIGSAEGFCIEIGRCMVFVMPGVPRELHRMQREEVEPRVRARLSLRPIARRMYRAIGLGESAIAERVEPIVAAARARSEALRGVFVHYRAAMPEVLVILEGTPDAQGHGASIDDLASLDGEMIEALRPAIHGVGEADLATRIVAAARDAALRIAFAESCTGGLAAAGIAAIPGASACLDGGVVAYDNRVKRGLLGVEAAVLEAHGAVSEPVARAMAEGARRSLGSDLAVAITGIAGPDGGTAEKPVGTVHIAVADDRGTRHLQLQLRGDRGTLQRGAASWAHKLLWDRLCERGVASLHGPTPSPAT